MSELSLITAASQTTDTERLLLARLNLRTGLQLRSTTTSVALASASRTTTTSTGNLSAAGARGILVLFNNTTTDATLQTDFGVWFGVGSFYSAYIPVTLGNSGLIPNTSVNTVALLLHPLLTNTAGGVFGLTFTTFQKTGAIPQTFRLGVGHTNPNPLTYSLTYCLIE
jgi:hypothetical protein